MEGYHTTCHSTALQAAFVEVALNMNVEKVSY
jgi:hypothetical protein